MKKFLLFLIVVLSIIIFGGCSGKISINLNAPTAPGGLDPASGETNVETTITLSWSVSVDPLGGEVSYDLYMGTTNQPEIYARNLSGTSYEVTGLQEGTTYYWRVVAKNEFGDSSSSAVCTLTTKGSSPGPSTGNYRGLTIGVNDYGGPDDLDSTDDDADEIKITFERLNEGYSIQKQVGTVTEAQVKNWLAAYVQNSSADDVFVFHYSGHGSYTGGQSVMNYSDNSNFTMSELRTALDAINGTKIVLIDACESGNFTNLSSGRVLTLEERAEQSRLFREGVLEAFEEDNTSRGSYNSPYEYYVLTGAAYNQYSNEDTVLNHGFFTFFFNDGLGNVGASNPSGSYNSTFDADGYGAGGNQNNSLTHRELYNYSKDKVSQYNQSQWGYDDQTVQGNHTTADFVIGTY